MTEAPLVTFALLAYNQERFVREAVEGAFAQTYEPLEIVLSDDCSADRTFEIMEELSKAYKGPHKVVLNRNESNLGVTEHLNRVVLEMARGGIIVLAAGDDVSLPNRTSRLAEEWTNAEPRSAVLSGYVKVDVNGSPIEQVSVGHSRSLTNAVDLAARLKRKDGRFLYGCTMSFRKAVFSRFGPLVVRDIEDGPILARAGLLDGVRVIGDVLVKYRLIPNSATRGADSVSLLIRLAQMRQQAYLQTLVDLNRMKKSALAVDDQSGRLENRIRRLLFGQEFIIWYLRASWVAQLVAGPALVLVCGWDISKELLAAAFPGAYSLYSRSIRRRGR